MIPWLGKYSPMIFVNIMIYFKTRTYSFLVNSLNPGEPETKPTNGLLTDRFNSKDQKTDNSTNNRRLETHQ